MKLSFLALAGFALMASTSFVNASPSAIPGQNCEVNWVGGACGPTVNLAGSPHEPARVSRPCREDDPREKCECGEKNS